MSQISLQDLPRLRDVAVILAQHGFGEFARMLGLDTQTSASDKPFARRLRLALADLGPSFIKLGQVLSVRPDIFSKEILDELSQLQDNTPIVPFAAVKALVEEEFRLPLEGVFSFFAEEPIAAASIAQVHLARLLSGEEVAVKVQRPNVERTLRSDIHILYTLARLVQDRLSIPGLYTPVEIVQEFEAAIFTELDFLHEAGAAERFRANHLKIPGVRAPQIQRAWCTRRVLVMERMIGRRLNQVPGGSEEGRFAMRKLIESWYHQLFEHGFFHGDPHPGNLMLLDSGELCFLDFGLTGALSAEMQDFMTAVFTGLVFRDAETVAMSIYRAGGTRERVDLKAFRSEIQRLMLKYEGASMAKLSEHGSLTEFITVANRFGIQVPKEFAVISRATAIVDGIARRLLADVDIIEEVRPYAQRLVTRRFGPERLGADAFRLVQYAQMALADLPSQTSQLLLDLEKGRIRVVTVDPDGELLREELRLAAVRICIALAALSLVLLGGILLAAWPPVPYVGPVFAAFGAAACGLAGFVYFALVAHWLFASRLHPREWRRRLSAVIRFFIGDRAVSTKD